MIVYGI